MKQVTMDLYIFLRLLRLATHTELRTTGADVRAFMVADKALSDARLTYAEIAQQVEQPESEDAQPCSSSE